MNLMRWSRGGAGWCLCSPPFFSSSLVCLREVNNRKRSQDACGALATPFCAFDFQAVRSVNFREFYDRSLCTFTRISLQHQSTPISMRNIIFVSYLYPVALWSSCDLISTPEYGQPSTATYLPLTLTIFTSILVPAGA